VTYPLLTLTVVVAFAVYAFLMRRWINWRFFGLAAGFMFVMTFIFDNLIIAIGIVDYDYEKTLGLRLLLAPIEDFAYTLVALVLVPSLFNFLRSRL
jgi:lycopene cyclase domain-containing protein